MPAIVATAPGKVILFGEHAVVYGKPAIAAPVFQLRAKAFILAQPAHPGGWLRVEAPQIGLDDQLSNLQDDAPIGKTIRLTALALGLERFPALHLKVNSTIPIASGLGSGAAISTAVVRALAAFMNQPISDQKVSDIVFEIEKIYHGNPSGIDNTVIAHGKPVFFLRERPIELLSVGKNIVLIIANCGMRSSTREMVLGVRQRWQNNLRQYDQAFDQIEQIVRRARQLIVDGGSQEELGELMNKNHQLLNDIGVSTFQLNILVETARSAGALGAKLCGAGGGGNMIALTTPEAVDKIHLALLQAGAVDAIDVEIESARQG